MKKMIGIAVLLASLSAMAAEPTCEFSLAGKQISKKTGNEQVETKGAYLLQTTRTANGVLIRAKNVESRNYAAVIGDLSSKVTLSGRLDGVEVLIECTME